MKSVHSADNKYSPIEKENNSKLQSHSSVCEGVSTCLCVCVCEC